MVGESREEPTSTWCTVTASHGPLAHERLTVQRPYPSTTTPLTGPRRRRKRLETCGRRASRCVMASPAACRMLPRLSPLVTALLVGALPWLAVVLPLSIWSTPLDSFVLQTVLHAIVVAVVGLWVLRRSPASLLPITAFLVLAYAVPSLVVFWAGPRFAVGESVDWLILGLHWALALALIVQGRMWRRPDVSRAESLAAVRGRDGKARRMTANHATTRIRS